MTAHRVAILFQLPLIGRAIQQLLESADDIEIVACLPDEPAAWSQVLQRCPDVVIKVGEEGVASTSLPLQLPEEALHLIHLHSAGNQMRLYQARQITVKNVEDLLQVIRAGKGRADIGLIEM